MTEEELKRIAELVSEQERASQRRKTRHKGLFSRLIVLLCIALAIGYTAICLMMQWRTEVQPEPQLTIAFFAFISAELWNLAKIKRHKEDVNKNE